MNVTAKRPGGSRLNADKGGQKLAKSCGNILWLTPSWFCINLSKQA